MLSKNYLSVSCCNLSHGSQGAAGWQPHDGVVFVGQQVFFCSTGQHFCFFSQVGLHFSLHLQDAVFSHLQDELPQFAGFKLLHVKAFADKVVADKATSKVVANNVFFIISPFQNFKNNFDITQLLQLHFKSKEEKNYKTVDYK